MPRPVAGGADVPTVPDTVDVLVVDDEPQVRAVVREYLEITERCVIEAGNGIEALWNVKHHHPRAVVLDLVMPRLGGLDTIRHIRRFDAAIRIVVVSGYLTPETVASLGTMGVATLEKPADLAELDRLLSAPRAGG